MLCLLIKKKRVGLEVESVYNKIFINNVCQDVLGAWNFQLLGVKTVIWCLSSIELKKGAHFFIDSGDCFKLA